ncbi:adenine deaminase [Marinilabiliaceae bacterium JC017]|nr:adenine deaminase [Marinilabiliaceae bacterium JC017]
MSFAIRGNIVDVNIRELYFGELTIKDGKIKNISRISEGVVNAPFLLPGLVDSHVHIESSMLIPVEFSNAVVPHGTVAVVTDPHEIANVLGIRGVQFMMENAKKAPLKCFFGVPSCVPATEFETAGASIDTNDVKKLFDEGAYFLSEMMNFPGVIHGDSKVIEKLKIAKERGKVIDGHAPGLMGSDLEKYIKAGISTDHECSTVEEALARIGHGMKIQIREGSAARNFEQLHSLIKTHSNDVMVCTDDSHPDEIIKFGHIDKIIRRGLKKGYSIFDLYKAACINTVNHYNLPVGLLRKGDFADFIVVDNLIDFNISATYINGNCVFEQGKDNRTEHNSEPVNAFNASSVKVEQLKVFLGKDKNNVRVIEVLDGELFTKQYNWCPKTPPTSEVKASLEEDIIKIVVLNRYKSASPVVGFVKNFGLKKGAIGGTIAHDSHNIIVIGVDDASIVKVFEHLIEMRGGICAAFDSNMEKLPLPFAGLMTNESAEIVAEKYKNLNKMVVSEMGCKLKSPFMTMSFMSLLVIPELKIGDKGLFDVNQFKFVDVIF